MQDTLTLERLSGACPEQLALIRAEWPDGIPLTRESAERASALHLNFDWAAGHLLPAQALDEYRIARDQALADYNRVLAQAWADYDRSRESQARADYDRILVQAWDDYERACAQALADYDRSRAQALLRLLVAQNELPAPPPRRRTTEE